MAAQYSPPSRNYPQELPDYWKFEDGTVRTDLQELSDAELEALGWHGPITMPEDIEGTSKFTHNFTWNSDTLSFDVEEISDIDKQKKVNYKLFWERLIKGNGILTTDSNGEVISYGSDPIAYKKIKDSASQSLQANTIVTEFISLLNDAKYGNPDVEKIQESLIEILSNINFTTEELAEIQQAFTESGMFAVYTLA
jgi:hypothetical protein